MEFRTKVEIKKKELSFSHKDKVLMLGSCFTDNIGEKLINAGFDCIVNPFGPLYNPISILNALTNRTPEFYEWTQEKQSGNINLFRDNDAFQKVIDSTNVFILTFGTSWVYRLKETGHVVANCKKQPEKLFKRIGLGSMDISLDFEEFLDRYIVETGKKVIFTVSPIRHKKDGLHENQLSKANLLLAIDDLCDICPENCFYFPSYEIMMDELRDYRFYADDMLHPSNIAVDYIWERFKEAYFTKKTIGFIDEFETLNKTLNHRPFNAESDEYKQLIAQTKDKLDKLRDAVQN